MNEQNEDKNLPPGLKDALDNPPPTVETVLENGDSSDNGNTHETLLEKHQRQAAEGLPQGFYNLGLRHSLGKGVPQDHSEALRLYCLASDAGSGRAQYNLAVMYDRGDGVESDVSEAIRYYKLAADDGIEAAEDRLADLIGSLELHQRKADEGVAAGQFNLGLRYYLGREVPVDHEKAVRLFQMAADQGDARAHYNLSIMFEKGEGVDQDPKAAKRHLEKAAELGSKQARAILSGADIDEIDEGEGDAFEEIMELIGLGSVKEEIRKLRARLTIQKQKKEHGLSTSTITLHMVFTGNPGTGKTTIARLVTKLFKQIGILPKGHLVEVDRSSLVGKYLGQTATKTKEVIESAEGGVLFIDEAHALVPPGGVLHDPYGSESVKILLAEMENKRDELAVIVAGYPQEMKQFIDSDPGLKSRFSRHINFPNFTAGEMREIFEFRLKRVGMKASRNVKKHIEDYAEQKIAKDKRDGEVFGNARHIRNIIEHAIENQAVRLVETGKTPTKKELITLEMKDFAFLAENLA